MTESDIIGIESKLGVRVLPEYRQLMLSESSRKLAGVFYDAQQVIAANKRNQQMSWLGRPLDRVFFIFGADESGRELYMDFDVPEAVVFVADYEHKRGKVLARTFGDWISRHNHVA